MAKKTPLCSCAWYKNQVLLWLISLFIDLFLLLWRKKKSCVIFFRTGSNSEGWTVFSNFEHQSRNAKVSPGPLPPPYSYVSPVCDGVCFLWLQCCGEQHFNSSALFILPACLHYLEPALIYSIAGFFFRDTANVIYSPLLLSEGDLRFLQRCLNREFSRIGGDPKAQEAVPWWSPDVTSHLISPGCFHCKHRSWV